MDHILGILAGPVHVGLVAVVHLDAELLHGLLELVFELLGIGGELIFIFKGIGNVGVRAADILFHIAVHLGYVDRNLPQPVIFVPAEQQPGLFAHFPQRLHHEVAGSHIAEITDMNGTGGADAGSADIFLLVRLSGDDFSRNFL